MLIFIVDSSTTRSFSNNSFYMPVVLLSHLDMDVATGISPNNWNDNRNLVNILLKHFFYRKQNLF